MKKMLRKNDLQELRNQIVLNSLFIGDYKNTLGLDTLKVSNFFDGYIDYLRELAKEDLEYKEGLDFHSFIEKYDTIDNLWDWYNCFDEEPLLG